MSFWNVFFLALIYIPLLLIWVFALVDLFRHPQLSGLAKAMWVIAIVLLPIVGMLIYFATRPPTPEEEAAAARARTEAAGSTVAEQLEHLADLRDRGVIDDTELARAKEKLLA